MRKRMAMAMARALKAKNMMKKYFQNRLKNTGTYKSDST